MSIVAIRKALNKALKAVDTSMPTAYENAPFEPTAGTAYQAVQLQPGQPDNPTLGDGFYREYGTYQIFLCYPISKGTGPAETKAQQLREAFARGSVFVEDGIPVHIQSTPQIAGGIQSDDRYIVPVLISYYADVHV